MRKWRGMSGAEIVPFEALWIRLQMRACMMDTMDGEEDAQETGVIYNWPRWRT